MNFKKVFLAGLILILPATVTIYILVYTFNIVDSFLGNILVSIIGHKIPGLGFLATIVIIYLVGLVATNVVGKKIFAAIESMFCSLPVVKPLYTSIQQIIDAFSSQKKGIFESVVMLEYPRKGLYAVGFKTMEGVGEIQEKTDEEVLNVFLPTTPNPTSGFLLMVPKRDVIPLEMSVEEALKLIVSGGFVSPEWPKKNGSEGEKQE